VKSQDILLDINGKPVNVRFPEEIAAARKLIADLPIASEAILTIKRNKETMTLNAKTEKLQGAVGEEKEFKTWGLSVRELTRAYANEAQLDDTQGVVVTTESPGYAAAKAELAPGDVIRSVNRLPATDLDEFSKLYTASVEKKGKVVVLEIQRGRGKHTAVLKVDYDE
jgi:serine protease Do